MMLYNYHLTHNLKVGGSNPPPATSISQQIQSLNRLDFL